MEARQTPEIATELDASRADLTATEALLDQTEIAYQAKIAALAEAKANLERARQEMGRLAGAR